MNIDHLKIFSDLAKTHSYTKTAANVFMTQPAITQAIQSLERELDVQLVDRNRSGVRLTRCGTLFLNEIAPALEQLDQAICNVKTASERYDSSISVGYSGTFLETRKVHELKRFLQNHPDVTIHMENYSMNKLRQYLLDGQCDVVFQLKDSSIDDADFDFFQLQEGRFAAVLPKGHPLSKRKSLTMEDLEEEPFVFLNANQCSSVQRELQDEIKRCSRQKTFYSIDSHALLHELVKNGMGIAVMPDFLEDPEQRNITLVPLDRDIHSVYGIITKKNNKNPVVRQVIREIAHG